MGIFRQFPYSNFHDMNMDEIIKIVRNMLDEWVTYKADLDELYTNIGSAFEDFQHEFDTFISSIDVPAEFDAALNRLIVSGQFADIVRPICADVASGEASAWLAAHITQPTNLALDTSLTVSGAAADAKVCGDWLFPFMDNEPFDDYVDNNLDQGFWSTTNGQKYASPNMKCTRSLIPVHPGGLYLCNHEVEYTMYDKDRNFLGTRVIHTPGSFWINEQKNAVIRNDVHFIGISVPNTADGVELHRVNSENVTKAVTPFENVNYLYKDNFWSTATGTVYSSTNLSCICMAGLPAGSRWYVSNTASAQCCCIDSGGNDLTPVRVFDAYSNGYIYTIPEGTALTYFNIYNSHTDAGGDIKVDYITKITQPKKVLTLGDSLTWLDGTGAGGMEKTVGYQRELREMGYEVDKRAWSGFSYTDGVNPIDPTTSLYNEIVDNQLDVSGYEYITILGGTNDISYSAPIGSTPNDYEFDDYNDSTMCGAISGILQYIRLNNPDAKIMVLNPPKNDHSGRKYQKAKQYINAINTCAEFWDCALVDLWHDMQASPEANYGNFFYDSSHPNYFGMRRIGTLLTNRMKALYSGLVK